jgi:hypothetical protein
VGSSTSPRGAVYNNLSVFIVLVYVYFPPALALAPMERRLRQLGGVDLGAGPTRPCAASAQIARSSPPAFVFIPIGEP